MSKSKQDAPEIKEKSLRDPRRARKLRPNWRAGSEARNGIGAWINYYNGKRPHSTHGLLTPAEAYDTPPQTLKAAA